MARSSKSAAAPSKATTKPGALARKTAAKRVRDKRVKRSATSHAIATELAPAVAIALLDKTEQGPGQPAPALECLAAATIPSETAGNVRLQLLFENGAVLPVEMSIAAGEALSKGLAEELPAK